MCRGFEPLRSHLFDNFYYGEHSMASKRMMIDANPAVATILGEEIDNSINISDYQNSDGDFDLQKVMDYGDDRDISDVLTEIEDEVKNPRYIYDGCDAVCDAVVKTEYGDPRFAYVNKAGFYIVNDFCDDMRRGMRLNTSKGTVVVGTGDEDMSYQPFEDVPRLSFTVLASLIAGTDRAGYGEESNLNYVHKNAKDITVVDYVGDNRITGPHDMPAGMKLSAYNLRATHANHKKGYSLIDVRGKSSVWHRPATFVIRFKKQYFVLGQDENQYFGSELPAGSAPKTLHAAFEDLKPEAARKYRGKAGMMRQGEWFAVPVDTSEVPDEVDCVAVCSNNDDECLKMPRDDDSSASHQVSGNVRISRDGRVFANRFCMTHSNGDHQDMHADGDQWYTLHRNTAVVSYSAQGMD